MQPVVPEAPLTRESLRDQLHVWIARPENFRSDAALARYRSWLSDEELARADRYMVAGDRHLFLIAHALLRSTLSRYDARAPGQWQFTAADNGRPAIAKAGPARIGFNLSHTPGLVACIVSDEIDCGVDVEGLGRVSDPRGLARRYFSRIECDDLDRLSDKNVDARFVEYWTLKEAYVKARGLGLELPLDGFHMVLGRGAPIRIAFHAPSHARAASPPLVGRQPSTADVEVAGAEDRAERRPSESEVAGVLDDAESWQFDQWRPSRDHVLSIAARRRGRRLRDVIQREVQPAP
ncbi:MAG: 4'-phosphopantetheinyl transferase superfamily protein [Candidatus Binatia bacterium]